MWLPMRKQASPNSVTDLIAVDLLENARYYSVRYAPDYETVLAVDTANVALVVDMANGEDGMETDVAAVLYMVNSVLADKVNEDSVYLGSLRSYIQIPEISVACTDHTYSV